MCDTNPLTTTLLDSSNEVTILKVALLKVVFVVVSTALDEFGGVQAVLMAVTMWGCVYYLLDGVSPVHAAQLGTHVCFGRSTWSACCLDSAVALGSKRVTGAPLFWARSPTTTRPSTASMRASGVAFWTPLWFCW